ncbi:MAG: right-handed parallel beta-helix repeat-containing protein, partial [Sphingobacteriaceae bacterium]
NTGRVITGNIVLNGIGAPGGTDNPNKAFAHGIYIDDNAAQVEISGNTVGNCATYGIFIHNAHDIAIKQNTVYNNAVQLLMEHDNVAADKPIYNCTVTGNIFFAKQTNQLAAEYKTKDNDIANFGNFDNNSYYRPLDNDLTIGVLQQVNGAYSYKTLSVESWKALYGKDAGSTKSSHNIPAYSVTKVTGSNQFSNGAFENNAGGLYAYASANNCTTGWDNGHLDGGALKVSFSSASNSANYGSVIIGVGAVTAGKNYRLKFSMLGGNGNKAITAYLRQSGGGYSDLSERKAATITGIRQEKEYLFTATATEGNASIVFDVPEHPSPLYLDNIKLEQVDATLTNPDQYISFLYNTTTSTKSYSISQSYDAAGTSYSGSIKLNPFPEPSRKIVDHVDFISVRADYTTLEFPKSDNEFRKIKYDRTYRPKSFAVKFYGRNETYPFTEFNTSFVLTSPPTVSVALFGPYQRRKKFFRSFTSLRF